MRSVYKMQEATVPETLDDALALLARRDAEMLALRESHQDWMHAVSHDLRAPLRHLIAFNPLIAESLRSSCPESEDLEDARSFLKTMDQSAQRMAQMLDGLLQLARVQNHVLQWETVDVGKVLKELQEYFHTEVAGRNIEWIFPQSPTVVRADAYLLEQALMAGLSNAVKFTKLMPQARIKIDTCPDVHGGVSILIQDNGTGFEPLRAGRLFGIFQRMHRETEFEGVGVGLALVRAICRRHGWGTDIQARPGAGCLLRISGLGA